MTDKLGTYSCRDTSTFNKFEENEQIGCVGQHHEDMMGIRGGRM